MKLGVLVWLVVLALVGCSTAEKWVWPERTAESVRIDTKVAFDDRDEQDKNHHNHQNDELPFQEPSETDGFYNRPPGSGRYPVRVEGLRNSQYRVDGNAIYPLNNNVNNQQSAFQDGTLDSLQYCKCVSAANSDCNPRPNSEAVCGGGKHLCCHSRSHKIAHHNSEFFNELEDERPMLLPGREHFARPFPPPSGSEPNGFFGPYGHAQGDNSINAAAFDKKQGVLVGPDGPTGHIGPQLGQNVLVGPGGPTGIIGPNRHNGGSGSLLPVLVGPGGPTGIIGPNRHNGVGGSHLPVLVGPGGPTGMIGPNRHSGVDGSQRPVLVGPEGPTGVIGPNGPIKDDSRRSETAQRGVLVGPGGPTGIIGPTYGRRPVLFGPGGPRNMNGNRGGRGGYGVLVGPGGPTGMIGPYGRPNNGILTGPGGPTGSIGPRRGVLVGPGGPTGLIGPQGFFGK